MKQREAVQPIYSTCPHCRTNIMSKYAHKNHACGALTKKTQGVKVDAKAG